jgi:hypothetical protein
LSPKITRAKWTGGVQTQVPAQKKKKWIKIVISEKHKGK